MRAVVRNDVRWRWHAFNCHCGVCACHGQPNGRADSRANGCSYYRANGIADGRANGRTDAFALRFELLADLRQQPVRGRRLVRTRMYDYLR